MPLAPCALTAGAFGIGNVHCGEGASDFGLRVGVVIASPDVTALAQGTLGAERWWQLVSSPASAMAMGPPGAAFNCKACR